MDLDDVLQQLYETQDSTSSSEDEQLALPSSKELLRDVDSDSDDGPSFMDDSYVLAMSMSHIATEDDLQDQFQEETEQVQSVCKLYHYVHISSAFAQPWHRS